MNRRQFLKAAASLGALVALSPSLVAKAGSPAPEFRPNPDWVNAEYEIVYGYLPKEDRVLPIIFKRSPLPPVRFNMVGGEFVEVPRFTKTL